MTESNQTLDALRKFDAMPDAGFIGVKTVALLMNCSPATIWRWAAKRDGFPKPIKLSGSKTVFRVGDIKKKLTEFADGAAA